MFATEGFGAIAQNYISRGIASNFYPKLPFLALLGALTLGNNNKDVLQIGRPGVGEILSGKLISPAERLTLGSVNSYKPRIQRFETDNSKWMGAYDTLPTVANPTTTAQSQAMQATADFRWSDLATPILVWHEDKLRAGQKETKEGQGLAMSQLIDEASEVAFQEHVKKFNAGIWTGNPSSQAADPWDSPLGIIQALDTTNTYGNVDRSVGANAAWKSQKDTTTTATDIVALIDDANLNKKLRVYGPGADIFLCDTTRYQTFKRQILNNGGVVLQNGPVLKMAAMGVKQEILQKDNAYVMYDPTCPDNTVLALTSRTWRLAFHPQRNMTVKPFVDLSDKSEGAKDADQSFVRTRIMFSNDNPYLNVRYTAIGT